MPGQFPEIDQGGKGALYHTVLIIPLLLFAVASFGYFDAALLGLWAVHALDFNISADRAAYLLTVLAIGNVVLQFPIGWLADHISHRLLLGIGAAYGLIGAIVLPFMDLDSLAVVPLLIVWGDMSFGTYTVFLTTIGGALSGAHLISANGGLSLMWGSGALFGTALTGVAMDLMGSVGFSVSIAAV